MDIKQLNIFLDVCKYKSFYQASKMLYMTPQGVSKIIKSLEDELGMKLFHRSPKGLLLTQEGDFLYQNSNDLIMAYNTLIKKMSNLKDTKMEFINLRVATNVLCTLPPDFLLSFTATHPNIKLTIAEDYEVECEKCVFDETADIALTISPIDIRKFNCFPVMKKQIYILVNKEHPLAQREKISLRDLDGEKIVTLDYKHRSYLYFEQICREKGICTHIVDMTNSCLGLYYKASAQKCVGFTVEGLVDQLNYPSICLVPINLEEYSWDISLITKKGKGITKSTQTFIDHILNNYSVNG